MVDYDGGRPSLAQSGQHFQRRDYFVRASAFEEAGPPASGSKGGGSLKYECPDYF
jgi:hypothetical protein